MKKWGWACSVNHPIYYIISLYQWNMIWYFVTNVSGKPVIYWLINKMHIRNANSKYLNIMQ